VTSVGSRRQGNCAADPVDAWLTREIQAGRLAPHATVAQLATVAGILSSSTSHATRKKNGPRLTSRAGREVTSASGRTSRGS